MIISLNGKLLDEREAVISVMDHGFLYGVGLFETFRTYAGRPFLLESHLERLLKACEALQIEYQRGANELVPILNQLLNANGLEDGYFRLTVTGGEGQVGLPAGSYDHPQEIIYVKQLPPRDEALYQKGKPLQLLTLRRNSPEGKVRFKSLHYMNNIMGKQELMQYPWALGAEGLFINDKGHVAEGIVSNVFFIRKGICCTPALETGILPGVTRGYILDCCRNLGIPYEEGYYHLEELVEAQEVFITNSIQEIVPIHALFNTSGDIAAEWTLNTSSVTNQLIKLYRQNVFSAGGN